MRMYAAMLVGIKLILKMVGRKLLIISAHVLRGTKVLKDEYVFPFLFCLCSMPKHYIVCCPFPSLRII